MHINTLRISKYGPQPLLVEWRVDAQTQTDFHAAVVLPTIDKQPGYRHVATLRFPCGRDHAKGFESQLSVVERAARLLALQLAEEMAADAEHRAPVSVEPLETLTLRAAWSL